MPPGRPAPVRESRGTHECFAGTTLLGFRHQTYIRDPDHRISEKLVLPFERLAHPPADARPTGYRDGERELWMSPSDARDFIYIVTPRGTERWPLLPYGCA